MSDSDELTFVQQAANDHLHNPGIKRRVAYISSIECIEKCDCLPKVKGRVVYTHILKLELNLLLLLYRNR